ncbi:MAG: hypothetical protein SCI25_15485 [Desulfuromonadales bacterium]|nr:hypothetical protein [Desulfuromonadales bacterium]
MAFSILGEQRWSGEKLSPIMDGRIWRLDWFGGLGLHKTEPRILVVFKPLHDDWRKRSPDPFHNNAVDHQKTVVENIRVGYFPKLYIGSFWQYGKPSSKPWHQPEKINLSPTYISDETTEVVSSSYSQNGKYLISAEHFIGHGSAFRLGKILAINYKNVPLAVLIPCAEIFRFYYGLSSKLSKLILRGDMESVSNPLYNPSETYPNEMRPAKEPGLSHLRLRAAMDGIDAWVIARIAFSQKADFEARAIYKTAQRAAINEAPPSLVAKFPFEGETKLSLQGKFIHSMGKRRFLVFRILSCSGKFPFEDLEYDRDNDGIPGDGNPEGKKQSEGGNRPQKEPIDKTDWDLGNTHHDDPSWVQNIRANPITPVRQFLDLQRKKLTRVFNTKNEYIGRKGAPPPMVRFDPAEVLWSTGDPEGHDWPVGQVNLETEHETDGQDNTWTLLKTIDYLERLSAEKRWRWETISLFGLVAFFKEHTLSFLPTEYQQRKLGPFTYLLKRKKRKRIVFTAKIYFEEGICYLLEFEKRPADKFKFLLVAAGYDSDDDAIPVLRDMVAAATILNGVWDNDGIIYPYPKQSMQHRGKDHIAFGEKIYDAFKQIIQTHHG